MHILNYKKTFSHYCVYVVVLEKYQEAADIRDGIPEPFQRCNVLIVILQLCLITSCILLVFLLSQAHTSKKGY